MQILSTNHSKLFVGKLTRPYVLLQPTTNLFGMFVYCAIDFFGGFVMVEVTMMCRRVDSETLRPVFIIIDYKQWLTVRYGDGFQVC